MGDEVAVRDEQLMRRIAKILEEARASHATHNRKVKELSALRSHPNFFASFSRTLVPLFSFQQRNSSAERIVRFVAAFTCAPAPKASSGCDNAFLEKFLGFLLVAASASNKTVRFRACQIISEIILRLPDDAEVDNQVWDEVIEGMILKVKDKAAVVRMFAIRALSRFVNDSENTDILDLFLEVLPLEPNAEVRKTLVLSLPPSNATSQAIIDCTLDVSDSVRKASYCVLANKFPLQSLSIKHRTIILRRGLADRSVAVAKECLKLMRDEWLLKSCKGDPMELLKYLDVETYEPVGESVMEALLKDGFVKIREDESIQHYIGSHSDKTEAGELSAGTQNIRLMEAEAALYWRVVCRHLQTEAHEKGSEAAATMGTEAAVYAAKASDDNDLLERILPATIFDYICLVKVHMDAGPNYRFASRQLLLVGTSLDFSDATNRKVARAFVRELLQKPLEHELDDGGNMVAIGDGINLGGDREWATAVTGLARKVHSGAGEFEEVFSQALEELAQPCRERAADFLQWMHCLALTSLLLENSKSFRWLQGQAIEPEEILRSLLLPGAKHVHLDVQRVSVRCLGLFGLVERKPSEDLVKQLRLSFIKGPPPISREACRALVDLMMWHGPQEIDRALGNDHSTQFGNQRVDSLPTNGSDMEESVNTDVLDLLCGGFDRDDWVKVVSDENESICAVLAEGFAKILLLRDKYPSISKDSQASVLRRLICLYFSNETKDLPRLRQCLSVFFEHYPSLSVHNKEVLCKVFIPVMRSMWPGIDNNTGNSPSLVSNMRKRAVQASRYMLQMMQAPMYPKVTETQDGNLSSAEATNDLAQSNLEHGEEGLAIRTAAEVARFPGKKTAAERSYISALCRVLVLLNLGSSDQEAVKLLRSLLNHALVIVAAEKDLVKDMKQFSERLKALDRHPDRELLQEQADVIFERLGVDFKLDVNNFIAVPQTPVPCSTRVTRTRRRVRRESSLSDDEFSPNTVAPSIPTTVGARSQRASKTAALSKMTAKKDIRIYEEEGEESSDLTSEEDSDEDAS
ncbi:condensin complex subunit 3 [Rhodamnia argentea]|uniref:Condensin complex subunit 3 n=1 Tax=Rhodamnia argentea TaxID=178133 RepID=A0A8B8NEQ3_9MYRT|nr:condensin complex subunit 3 [Rhodamnia argentea]